MLPSYVGFLQSLKLKYIKVDQLIEPHTHVRNGVHNTLPPKAMWRNISSTLKVVDALAFRLELPVNELVSIYRSPAYNSRCPGAKSNSYHMRNNATDVRFTCPPGKVAAMARAMRGAGLYQGGVGRTRALRTSIPAEKTRTGKKSTEFRGLNSFVAKKLRKPY